MARTNMLHELNFALAVSLSFLGLAMLAYALFGGADFGAGIVEWTLKGPKHAPARQLIEKTLGPVWEANHIWLILAVVILFMGFPAVYARMSMSLHWPLTALLLGIIARGTSFTFRHYDAVRDGSRKWYSLTFRLSSVWTPFWLGITVGGMSSGEGIPPLLRTTESSQLSQTPISFQSAYIDPWWNTYAVSLGCFTVCLFAFLACTYLIGESESVESRKAFTKRARFFLAVSVPVGAMVFFAAEKTGHPLFQRFLHSPFALTCTVLATVSLPILAWGFRLQRAWPLRIIGGGMVSCILCAWFAVQYPILYADPFGAHLTVTSTAAPQATLQVLAWALILGSSAILPALYWLMRVFFRRKA